jgi:formate hydrogenlyase transcriptional activator
VNSAASRAPSTRWLTENGSKELEAFFQAILFQSSASILLVDNERRYQEASLGAAKLLGIPRRQVIGRTLDDFAAPSIKPVISKRWQDFLLKGEQAGALQLLAPDGTAREVEYTVKGNVLPVRHLLLLRDQTKAAEVDKDRSRNPLPSWVKDYALFLLNVDGQLVAWYAGAERLYGFKSGETIGRHLSVLYPNENSFDTLQQQLKRALAKGHVGDESWQVKKNGSRFWANVILMALKDVNGVLQGFAGIARDFSDRHENDEKLRRSRAPMRAVAGESTIAGVVSGEFDRMPEANDTFLELVGYSREDLLAGRLVWPELTPPEYVVLDEFAHEEGLRFGACTPFEKELVPVLVTTAVVQLSPFRWITFVNDLRERNRQEKIDERETGIEARCNFEEIIGTSTAIKQVLKEVEMVAPTDATVLILGETGTGKELIARAIHRISPRRDRPFISLNCAAIPTGLLESELFGYERGAFTGALSQKIGRFEMAQRGTLFLDEVGDIPLDLQPKLLRALQEKSFERLGGTKTIPIDVRLVAATNRNLTKMMGDKLFRSDLYYRLKVFPIITPPLRDHPEDIPMLARHFTRKYAAKMDRTIDSITSETMKALESWSWPGNVRELENFIERSVILSPGSILRAPVSELLADALEADGDYTLDHLERNHILRVLRETGGVINAAADRLGIPRTTLHSLMKKLGISRSDL